MTPKALVIVIAVLSVIVIGKVAHDFPSGEGLFYPTHAENIEAANTACLKKLEEDTATPQLVRLHFARASLIYLQPP